MSLRRARPRHRPLGLVVSALVIGILGLVAGCGEETDPEPPHAVGVDLEGPEAEHLLRRYQPVLRFHVGDAPERFRPANPMRFAKRSFLETRGPGGGGWARPDKDVGEPPPEECIPARCRLNLDGADVRRGLWAEYSGQPPQDAFGTLTVAAPGGTLELGGDGLGPRLVAWGRARQGSELDCCGDWIALQYWLFYDVNVWSEGPGKHSGYFQAHEGDWERVSVILDGARRPRAVNYSQHEGSLTLSWEEAPRLSGSAEGGVTQAPPARTHPEVFVARGSHANYPRPGRHQIRLNLTKSGWANQLVVLGLGRERLRDHAVPRPVDEPCPASAVERPSAAGPDLDMGIACYEPLTVTHLTAGQPWLEWRVGWGDGLFVGLGAASKDLGRDEGTGALPPRGAYLDAVGTAYLVGGRLACLAPASLEGEPPYLGR